MMRGLSYACLLTFRSSVHDEVDAAIDLAAMEILPFCKSSVEAPDAVISIQEMAEYKSLEHAIPLLLSETCVYVGLINPHFH
jgi:hypothetical protein